MGFSIRSTIGSLAVVVQRSFFSSYATQSKEMKEPSIFKTGTTLKEVDDKISVKKGELFYFTREKNKVVELGAFFGTGDRARSKEINFYNDWKVLIEKEKEDFALKERMTLEDKVQNMFDPQEEEIIGFDELASKKVSSKEYRIAGVLSKVIDSRSESQSYPADYVKAFEEVHEFVSKRLVGSRESLAQSGEYVSMQRDRNLLIKNVGKVIESVNSGEIVPKYKDKAIRDLYSIIGGIEAVKKSSALNFEDYFRDAQSLGGSFYQHSIRKDVNPVPPKSLAKKMYNGIVNGIRNFRIY